MPHAPTLLLTTKLYRPSADANWVARPALLDHLNAGLTRKLTLISAPPGFGKTTLVSQWLANCSLPAAWLALDEGDNNPAKFVRYLVAAVQTIFPEATVDAESLWRAPTPTVVAYFVTNLLNEVMTLDQPFLLVLDDYHCIAEKTIHQLLAQLIAHLPPQIHLVLISRTEPPLPLARLRAQQQMIEIRAADLAFSDAEAAAFLSRALGRTPTQETISILQEKIEGWIAGLQLAALSLRDHPDEYTLAAILRGHNRHIMDYLLEEALARQPVAIQNFLLCTAILERFSAPLCEVVLANCDKDEAQIPVQSQPTVANEASTSQEILAYLEQANLFLVALDEERNWYRYHHLFQELLRHTLQTRLAQDEIAALHRRASRWLAEHGWIEEAIAHAMAAGDALVAAQWVEQHRHTLIDRQNFSTLQRWLAHLPEKVVQRRPALLLAKAWVANDQQKLPVALALAQQAETGLADAEPPLAEEVVQALRGEIDTLRAIDCFQRGDGKALLPLAQQALTRIPATYGFVYSTATMGVGFGYLFSGQVQTALHFWQEKLDEQTVQGDIFRIRMLVALGSTQLTSGHLHQSLQTAHSCLQLATANQITFDAAWANYVIGVIHYQWNDLALASRHFSALAELLHRAPIGPVFDGMLSLALVRQVQGEPAVAQELVARAATVAAELRLPHKQAQIRAFQARLFLLQGNIEAAAQEVAMVNLDVPIGVMHVFEVPRLTQAQLLIAQGGQANRQAAREIMQPLRSTADLLQNVWRMAEILTLDALCDQAAGQTEQALATLTQAVKLTKPGRFIRLFVDMGPPLSALLYKLAARSVEAEYLGQVLAAFPPTGRAADPARPIRRAAQADLVEPLTERELEVLALLARRLSNKEIAQALTLSSLTVRTHTSNLYQKLGVNSRKQAVAKAETLGLLPTDQH